MHPDWARSLRDQCKDTGTAFFFKQWGEWQPYSEYDEENGPKLYEDAPEQRPDVRTRCRYDGLCMDRDGTTYDLGRKGQFPQAPIGAFGGQKPMSIFRVGKKKAGRLLDGIEHNGLPTTWDKV